MTDADLLIAQHQQLVADQVRRVLARVPAHVDRHDLRAAADQALARAARSFRPAPGLAFATYGTRQVQLALREVLRSLPLRALPPGPALTARLRLLESAIADLPDRPRAVVTSYFLRAQPATVVARELGLREDDVRAIVASALVTLRDALRASMI